MGYGELGFQWNHSTSVNSYVIEKEIQDSILNADSIFKKQFNIFKKEKGKKMSDTVDKIIMLLVEEKLLSEDIKLTEYITLKAKIVKILEGD